MISKSILRLFFDKQLFFIYKKYKSLDLSHSQQLKKCKDQVRDVDLAINLIASINIYYNFEKEMMQYKHRYEKYTDIVYR